MLVYSWIYFCKNKYKSLSSKNSKKGSEEFTKSGHK